MFFRNFPKPFVIFMRAHLPAFVRNKKFIATGALAAILAGIFVYIFFNARTINIVSKGDQAAYFQPHPASGIRCQNNKMRPYAVMLATDPITRPLSGISAADVIVEMPVVKDNITRLMALYACSEPPIIGSVRSARDDFIPLAASFDAIYAHWGGSSLSLAQLNRGIIDNIDALPNPYEAFFRAGTLGAPHNGFTSFENLRSAAEGLNYRTETNFTGYVHTDGKPAEDALDGATLSVKYPTPHNIDYIYDKNTNRYLRWRGGRAELDRLDNSQARAGVIVVLSTHSRALNADYNDVDINGSGRVLIFQNGEMFKGEWSKDASSISSKLFLQDADGNDISLGVGPIWFEIVDIGTRVIWQGDAI